MSIEQHAEAAVKDIAETYRAIGHMEGIGHPAEWAAVTIAKHMQSAIDEATASLKERIAQLEGLGPLIEKYIAETWRMFSIAEHSDEMIELNEQIKAILKGGAS